MILEGLHFIIDFILHVDRHLADLIAHYGVWVYGILFLILFCETGLIVTPFLPGDSLLFVAGILAALPANNLNVHLMVGLMISAAIIGDAVNYTIGRIFGEKLFSDTHAKIFQRRYLEHAQQFYLQHGGKAVIFARFIPIIRTFAPFVAGMGKMAYGYFSFCNIAGSVLWVMLFTYAGYFFGDIAVIKDNLKIVIVAIVILSCSPGIVKFWHKIKGNRKKVLQ